jgi:DNA-binding FrmR family transcriptional regulator
MQTKAEYRRKAAILVELLSAQRNEGGTASEAFMQQLAAFRVDIDEAMLHMLHKRLDAAVQHGEVCWAGWLSCHVSCAVC